MIQIFRTAAVAALFVPAICANAVASDDVDCPAGSKMKPKTIMCLPRIPRTWIVCSGLANDRGEGLWKDTGVPCEQAPPRDPAQYRPVPAIAHPPPLARDAKRVIDQFRGIFFHCEATVSVTWSGDACSEITAAFVRQAKADGVPYALVSASEPDAERLAKGEAAGIPAGSELQWTMTFKSQGDGEITLQPELSGVVELVPGIWSSSLVILGGGITMQSNAGNEDAVGAAGDLINADMQYLVQAH